MTGLSRRWPIWDIVPPITRSAMFCAVTAPEHKRTTTWAEFIRAHLAVLAGTDFFTVEVLTLRGLVTYYILFFIHLESRRIDIAGITVHPDEQWMQQWPETRPRRDAVPLRDCRFLLHDRDAKYTASFRAIIVPAAHGDTWGGGGVASGLARSCAITTKTPLERWVRLANHRGPAGPWRSHYTDNRQAHELVIG
jgi:hypothetical protein